MEGILQKPKMAQAVRWYREPWVWLVLGGPLIVVFAGIYTIFLAYHGADPVVTEDYYRQGIKINADLRRDKVASQGNIAADMQWDRSTGAIAVRLEGKSGMPATLLLSIWYPAADGKRMMTNKINLIQAAPGNYVGKLTGQGDSDAKQSWQVKLETTEWRLTAKWEDPGHAALRLKALQ